MTVSKSDVELKREKRIKKKAYIDKLTNWYMINLTWGALGFIALGFVESAFKSAVFETMNTMKILAAVFFVLGIVLFTLGKTGVIKNTRRAKDYSIFLGVLTVILLWIGFFTSIRNAVISVLPALAALRSEWWYAWGFRYLIVIYLVVGFIVVTIKTKRYEHGK